MNKIQVKGTDITIIQQNDQDYISLTDMVKNTDGDQLIKNWMRNKNTIEFLGIWEQLNNENFNMVEFDHIRKESGTNRFLMSVSQWVEKTRAVGVMSKSGRYGGTYAHKDIAFEFGTWISPEFKLLLIKDFQRLKNEESKLQNVQWDYRRFLTKANYRLHTDSIKAAIEAHKIPKSQESYIYANEAEILNVAVFGQTSKNWKQENPSLSLKGLNIRDVADIPHLTVLSNCEVMNAELLARNINAKKRLETLSEMAARQLKSLQNYNYPIESPHKIEHSQPTITGTKNSDFNNVLGAILKVTPPKNEEK